MGSSFQVVHDDLQDMADSFKKEAEDFAGLRPRMAPTPVDGGDPTVNAGIAAVLSLFGTLNEAISARMDGHGEKLQECHDGYVSTDADVLNLYSKVIEEA